MASSTPEHGDRLSPIDPAPIAPRTDALRRAADVMAAVRERCVWSARITHEDLVPYLVEESAELIDAVEAGTRADLREELGDLLWQVLFHAAVAADATEDPFDIDDVADALADKMIRRHPHVFGDSLAPSAGEAKASWERIKREEKAERLAERLAAETSAEPEANAAAKTVGLLASVPMALPALSRALKLQDKAASVGFDWPSLAPVFDKVREEIGELEEAVRVPADGDPDQRRQRIADELGDLLFVLANVARHLDIDAETALRGTNAKFVRRFSTIEARLAETGRTPAESDLAEMDRLWNEAKAGERKG